VRIHKQTRSKDQADRCHGGRVESLVPPYTHAPVSFSNHWQPQTRKNRQERGKKQPKLSLPTASSRPVNETIIRSRNTVDADCGVYSAVCRGAPSGIHPGRGAGGGFEFVPYVGGARGHARRVIPQIYIRNPRSCGGRGNSWCLLIRVDASLPLSRFREPSLRSLCQMSCHDTAKFA